MAQCKRIKFYICNGSTFFFSTINISLHYLVMSKYGSNTRTYKRVGVQNVGHTNVSKNLFRTPRESDCRLSRLSRIIVRRLDKLCMEEWMIHHVCSWVNLQRGICFKLKLIGIHWPVTMQRVHARLPSFYNLLQLTSLPPFFTSLYRCLPSDEFCK